MQPTETTTDHETPLEAAPEASGARRWRKALRPPAGAEEAEQAEAMTRAAAPLVADLRRDSMTLHKGELAQSLALAQRMGGIKAFQFNETINRVAMLQHFAEIRDTKAYKGLSVLDADGQPRVVNTWEEFCEVHGYSKQKINEDLQNLAVFGGSMLEAQEALGLGYRELRRLRAGIKALPPEEQQKVLDEIQSVEGSDEAKEKLDELSVQLAKARVENKELKADMDAKEKISKAKSEKLDKLQEQILKLTSVEPDKLDEARRELNATARQQLDTACHQAMGAMTKVVGLASSILQHDEMDDATLNFVHKRVSLLCEMMGATILNAGIDVDFRSEFVVDYGDELEQGLAKTEQPEEAGM